MNNEIYLYEISNSSFKIVDGRGFKNPEISKFPVLDAFISNKSNELDIFHLIEINKVIKRKDDFRTFLGNEYESYIKFKNAYINGLDKYNDMLFEKYSNLSFDFTPDCIIIPESKNIWLRAGLAEKFSTYLAIPILEAKKSIDIELSYESELPNGFEFIIDVDISTIKSALIVDDCKSKGNTINAIKSIFRTDTNFIEIFYLKSKP